MEGIQVSVEKTGPQSDISIIRVGGYIDTTTSSELERALDSLIKAGVFRVIIDLGNVDYISSAGWGIFISEIKGIRERGGDLKLAKMIPDVYEVFELLEFHYILKAFDTIDDAIRDFDGSYDQKSVESKPKIGKKEKESPLVLEEIPAAPDDEKTDFLGIQEETGSGKMSIEDKIKQVVTENPSWGPAKVSKALNTERFGNVKMGTISVWKIMKKLNLGNDKNKDKNKELDDWFENEE